MTSIRLRRRAPFAGVIIALLLLVSGCSESAEVPAEPAAAPDAEAVEAATPDPIEKSTAPEEPGDPVLTAETMSAVAMPSSKARDPFEPVRDLTETAVETSAGDGTVVPAAPAAPTPSEPPADAAPPTSAEPSPTPEPSAGTCDADLDACLTSLRLLDAGSDTEGPAIFQLGTTLYEVELGAGFADAFILLRIEEECATVGHRDGVAQRCVEPDSSLK